MLEDLIAELRTIPGIKPEIISHVINSILFADDIALIASSVTQLKEMLRICEQHSIRNRYQYAPQKCEVISATNDTEDLKLYGQNLKPTTSFKYLGTYFDKYGISISLQIAHNTTKIRNQANRLKAIGINAKCLSPETTIRAYKVFLEPILLYGCDIVPLNDHEARLINRAQAVVLKNLLCVPLNTSTGAVLLCCSLETAANRIDYLRIKKLLKFKQNDRHFMSRLIMDQTESHLRLSNSLQKLPGEISIETSKTLGYLEARKEILPAISHLNLLERHPPAFTTTVKEDIKQDTLNQLTRNTNKLHQRLISPSNTISNTLTAHTPTITRKLQRLIILWQLGVIPIHPYRTCIYCSSTENASRDHIRQCYEFDEKLPPPISWASEDDPRQLPMIPRANRLDRLINLLPILKPDSPEEDKTKWNTVGTFIQDLFVNVMPAPQ
jgi:hypothetical protein